MELLSGLAGFKVSKDVRCPCSMLDFLLEIDFPQAVKNMAPGSSHHLSLEISLSISKS